MQKYTNLAPDDEDDPAEAEGTEEVVGDKGADETSVPESMSIEK